MLRELWNSILEQERDSQIQRQRQREIQYIKHTFAWFQNSLMSEEWLDRAILKTGNAVTYISENFHLTYLTNGLSNIEKL